MIRIRGLTKTYGYLHALDAVDLDVAAGQFLVVFGPNGAGKTTLLKILAGLVRPTAGEIELGLAGEGAGRPVRTGYVSHHTFLYGRLTGRENLAYYARLYDLPARAVRIETLGEQVGLSDRLDDPVDAYSRGMRQRLAIARALLHDPDLLLLDEPFTGLDPGAADRLARQLTAWATSGRTVVMVSHELRRGAELAARIVVLSRGRIALDRDAAAVDPARMEEVYRSCLLTPRA